MEQDDAWLIRGLVGGDAEAIRVFCERYGPMLQQVADRQIAAGLKRRIGPESICQSACLSFLRRAKAGEYQLTSTDDLWKLLCAITLTKVREHVRYHRRQKRSVDREQPLAAPGRDGDAAALDPADPRRSPTEAIEFREHFDQILTEFNDEERTLIHLRLQDHTNKEIAKEMACSERTVRRILDRVKDRLEFLFNSDQGSPA